MGHPIKKAVLAAKVTTIVKNVVAKKPDPVSIYPTYSSSNEEYSSLAKMVDEDYDDDLRETGSSYDLNKEISQKESVSFGYDTESSPNTCGFIELGSLSASASSEKCYPHLAELLDAVVSYSKGYTLYMNTNGTKGACSLLEKVLPMTKHWVKVKTYRNPGSGNMLTLWVTNN